MTAYCYLVLIFIAIGFYRLKRTEKTDFQINQTRLTCVCNERNPTTTIPPMPSLSNNIFPFEFDNRPKNILYNYTFNEVKMCICGEYDCSEQSYISKLFPEPRPPFQQYKASLKNPKLRTSIKNSKYDFNQNILTIHAFDGNGLQKTYGGDFWIVRLKGVLSKDERLKLNR